MSKFLDHILVNDNSIIKLKQEDLCKEHSFPEKICKECKLSLINKLNIHKDIKQYLGNFIPDITTFSLNVSNYRVVSYINLSKFQDSCHLGNIILYFNECSEFIFGFLSFIASYYSVDNTEYLEKYEGRIHYEMWDKFKLKNIDNGKFMVSYTQYQEFVAYLTTDPREFKNGWDTGNKIEETIKYATPCSDISSIHIYEKEWTFENIEKHYNFL